LHRLAAWSALTGMVAVIFRLRRWVRMAFDEYALSASTCPGRVRGRPTRRRMRMPAMTWVKPVQSAR
jgi:hypothetical protein